MKTFALKPDEEYIQLNDLMKVLSWVSSGGEAKQLILNEQVFVNGSLEMRIRRKLKKGDQVQYGEEKAEIA